MVNKKTDCETCKNKLAIIIENKKYYCAECYLKKEGIKPLHQINDFEKNVSKD
jgi:protein-arginine kinase activator protein McsA